MQNKTKAMQDLQTIPGVGVRVAEDLWNLGYRQVADLRGEDPEEMYQRLCKLQGTRVDRCMLYTFRCAVFYSANPNAAPELLKWWNWSDQNLKKRKESK